MFARNHEKTEQYNDNLLPVYNSKTNGIFVSQKRKANVDSQNKIYKSNFQIACEPESESTTFKPLDKARTST